MPPKPPSRTLRFIREQPWCLLESYFDTMLDVVESRMAGLRLSDEERTARLEAARRSPATATAPGSIAVMPLFGLLAQHVQSFELSQDGTATEPFGHALRAALDAPSVGAIVLNVDSPGGQVYGTMELAALVRAGRERKPIVAVTNSMAASAAYWIASQATELVVTPGGDVGSIGVLLAHDDVSKAAENEGVKRTYISAPEGGYKAEGNPFEPLSDEATRHLQESVNEWYGRFVKAVSEGRRVSQTRVREEFGKGRLVSAEKAVTLGMADRIATLQETIDDLAAKLARKSGKRADESDRARARLRLAAAGG